MRLSVVLTTYNQDQWLEKVLWGYAAQTHQNFEIVIADDGSLPATGQLIARMQRQTGLALKHVWHPHEGFRKCRILNQAIETTTTDYLLFSDGDCIPRTDFVEQHVRAAEPGYILSGGTVRLPMALSQLISRDDIAAGRATSPRWLLTHGLRINKKILMLVFGQRLAPVMDAITPTRATWNGHNASGWKSDIVRANGFDERMLYGGLDRELGERLMNAGIRAKQIRHRAVCVHLDHPRSYVDAVAVARNQAIRRETRQYGFTWTPYGIRQADQLVRPFMPDAEPSRTERRRAA